MTQDDPKTTSFTTITTSFMLERLKNPDDRGIWQQFVERYRPMIIRCARRFGLGDEDAQDAAQHTLMAFFTAYRDGKYDREKGRLRHWLFGIARHWILNVFEKQRHREVGIPAQTDHTGFFARIPGDDRLEEIWEHEWRETTLQQCLAQVRQEFDAKTFRAFEMFAHEGLPARQVAEQLGMTSNAVFIAKHRVLKRIRELLPEME
jgi:RNA polymerase sigma factor (sigma-70 family)